MPLSLITTPFNTFLKHCVEYEYLKLLEITCSQVLYKDRYTIPLTEEKRKLIYKSVKSCKKDIEGLDTSLEDYSERVIEKINFEKMSTQVSRLLDIATTRLEEIDLPALQSDFSKSNSAFRLFLQTFSENYSSLGPELTSASQQAKSTLLDVSRLSKSLNLIMQPESDLRFEFSDTLRDVSLMAKSLKRLADLLERNPQAFLIGKPSSSEE